MIQHIKIENYKSIPSLELDLGRVNVFIGENGSGKTNILEAVALGSAAAEDKLGPEFLFSRGLRVVNSEIIKPGFSKKNSKKPVGLYFVNTENKNLDCEINGNNKVGNDLEVIWHITHPFIDDKML